MSKKRKRRKCDAMYRKYGEHSSGVFCGGCCNCQKRERDDGRWTYKCLAYGVTGTYETDWSPMFTACGFFNMPFNSQKDVPIIKRDAKKQLEKNCLHDVVEWEKAIAQANRKAGISTQEASAAFIKLSNARKVIRKEKECRKRRSESSHESKS